MSLALVRLLLVWAAAAALVPPAVCLLAFPGAEGFGREATGGRKGSVYRVTTLADKGKGSFREAVSKSDRVVVFEVGGTINITSRVAVSKNVYIAGQTAPGHGITIYGAGMSWSDADNAIVRYIRVRQGKQGKRGKDAIGIAKGKNMIFDHVSVSWGRDETFSINGQVHNVTIQDCIIGQGLKSHSAGGLMQTDFGVSLFRNLYVDNHTRNPKVKGKNDFQNNVVYNWGGGGAYIAGGDSKGESHANIVNNYFISGPNSKVAPFVRGNDRFHAYARKNYHDSDKDGTLNGQSLCDTASCYSHIDVVSTPFDYPKPQHVLDPVDAVAFVLDQVGSSFPHRDGVDAHLVDEVRSFGKLGQHISDETAAPVFGPGFLQGGKCPLDADGDGIPDEWELKHALNPHDPADAMKIGPDGYAMIEVYVNSLVPNSGPPEGYKGKGKGSETGTAVAAGPTSSVRSS